MSGLFDNAQLQQFVHGSHDGHDHHGDENSSDDKFVVIYATWCPHCHDLLRDLGIKFEKDAQGSVIAKSVHNAPGEDVIVYEEKDVEPALKEKLGVTGFPSVFHYHHGQLVPKTGKEQSVLRAFAKDNFHPETAEAVQNGLTAPSFASHPAFFSHFAHPVYPQSDFSHAPSMGGAYFVQPAESFGAFEDYGDDSYDHYGKRRSRYDRYDGDSELFDPEALGHGLGDADEDDQDLWHAHQDAGLQEQDLTEQLIDLQIQHAVQDAELEKRHTLLLQYAGEIAKKLDRLENEKSECVDTLHTIGMLTSKLL